MAEIFDWLKPVPFWDAGGNDSGEDLIRPTLLEFASDNFLDDFLAEATSGSDADWQKLHRRVIPYVTPGDVPPDDTDPQNPVQANAQGPLHLKLFQPAHRRYYLLCASLCCRQPGFPDRVARKADGESVTYVLRKVDATGQEFGWTVNGAVKQWQPVSGNPKTTLPDEERLPMFATSTGDARTLIYGYVAVASRDTYAQSLPVADKDPAEERRQQLAQFTENIARPLDQLLTPGISISDGTRGDIAFYFVSDLGAYLDTYFKPLADAIRSGATPASGLLTYLTNTKINGDPAALTLHAALQKVYAQEAGLQFRIDGGSGLTAAGLQAQVDAALPTPSGGDGTTRLTPVPKLTADNKERFLLRCVYERPCDAPFPPRLLVSAPTYSFDMAAFFDTDAPARPIRIEMPADISIAALRKFRRGVGFLMSNTMRNKMSMATDGLLKDPPKPGGEENWSLGMLCSFSIQIIFIVAFFLLLVFVIVFNIIFWWLPFFRICLPIPKKSR